MPPDPACPPNPSVPSSDWRAFPHWERDRSVERSLCGVMRPKLSLVATRLDGSFPRHHLTGSTSCQPFGPLGGFHSQWSRSTPETEHQVSRFRGGQDSRNESGLATHPTCSI